jgi:hypothetical protein
MLYNFNDSPADLFERMRLNVRLNEELSIRIWSFPMRYQPTDRPDRGHVGKKWTKYQLRSMQIILQATHGIVSGAPDFFKRAFGDTSTEFEEILLHPHDFTFNRDWYENQDVKQELHEYRALAKNLSDLERAELLALLSSCDPRRISELHNGTTNDKIRAILPFYVPKPKAELFRIWAQQKTKRNVAALVDTLAEDERVEDAGLDVDDTEAEFEERLSPKVEPGFLNTPQKKRVVA